MMSKWLVLIIVIIIILAWNWMSQRHRTRPMISLDELIRTGSLKTGDLLFFRHHDANKVIRFMFGDEFSHVGLVCVIGGIPYVCEAVSGGDMCDIGDCTEGVKCSPIAERLQSYGGYICYKQLNKPLTEEREKALLAYLLQRKTCKFCSYAHDGSIISVMVKCLCGLHYDLSDCTVCSAFIAGALKAMGILRDKKELQCDACFRPQTIHALVCPQSGSVCYGYQFADTVELDCIA